ncbi:hypothetical protein GGR16_004819 [Chelatococcus caeni]|uniref:Heparinase n=1 Tax=Chelatococcus caeni TaxID=1348468 RepID=A0A840C2G0_9HYPH|nr:hypothetical protein [Chelatococcus caeni]
MSGDDEQSGKKKGARRVRPGLDALLQPGLAKAPDRVKPFQPPRLPGPLKKRAQPPKAAPVPPPAGPARAPGSAQETGGRELLPVVAQYGADSAARGDGQGHVVEARNRRARVQFSFGGVPAGQWCELAFALTWADDEKAGRVPDAVRLGFDFQTGDGVSLDLPAVAGLMRGRIDPFSIDVAGPAAPGRKVSQVRVAFQLPAHAERVELTVRSWRNTAPFEIATPRLRPLPQPPAEAAAPPGPQLLDAEPQWESWGVVPGGGLTVRGQLLCATPAPDMAFARIVYRDAKGRALPRPYEGTLEAEGIGAFVMLPTDRRARRFTLRLAPPAGARSVDIGFQARGRADIRRILPYEVSPDDGLADGTEDDPLGLLGRLAERFGIAERDARGLLASFVDEAALAAAPFVQADLAGWLAGGMGSVADGRLRLAGHEDWSLPEIIDWQEDPFGCGLWRARYHALGWLVSLTEGGERKSLAQAVALALSWQAAAPRADVDDEDRFGPRTVAIRVEVLLQLLAQSLAAGLPVGKSAGLVAEIVRHARFLAEALGDNLIGEARERLHAAAGLAVVAAALPRLPLAALWRSMALNHIEWSAAQLFAETAMPSEGSSHLHFEALAVGLALQGVLAVLPGTEGLRRRMALPLGRAIATSVALTDPDGCLAPFGETTGGAEHLPILRDLIARCGRDVMAEPAVAEMLAARASAPLVLDRQAGLVTARHRDGRDWAYFATRFGASSARGHDDCGSFVYAARGIRWITDPGGIAVRGDGGAGSHFRTGAAHNILRPVDAESVAGCGWLAADVALEGASAFLVDSNVHGTSHHHRRLFLLLDDLSGIAVFDRLASVEPGADLAAEGFLHLGPGVAGVLVAANLGLALAGNSRLQIVAQARAGVLNGLSFICGQEAGTGGEQGFLSGACGEKEPANVLRYSVAGKGDVTAGVLIAMDDTARRRLAEGLGDPRLTMQFEMPFGGMA